MYMYTVFQSKETMQLHVYVYTVPDKNNLRVTRYTRNLYCVLQARPICKILRFRGRYACGTSHDHAI